MARRLVRSVTHTTTVSGRMRPRNIRPQSASGIDQTNMSALVQALSVCVRDSVLTPSPPGILYHTETSSCLGTVLEGSALSC